MVATGAHEQRVAIIGGGVNGVSTARALLAEGVDCVLFERDEDFGGVWAGNYDSFGIQVVAPLYAFPDEPLKAGDYASGDAVCDYVRSYAKKHAVYKVTRFGRTVVGLKHEGGQWSVTTKEDGAIAGFTSVVIATGVYSNKSAFIPNVANKEAFNGEWLHSVDFRDPEVCRGKRVVVVGFGKSALDCAAVSAKNGAVSTTLVYRTAHWPVPRKILGLVPFEFATFNRFGSALVPPAHPSAGPIERAIASVPGFITAFWKLTSVIFSKQFGLGDLEPQVPLKDDMWGGHGVLPDPKWYNLVRNGSIETAKGEVKAVVDGKTITVAGADGDSRQIPADVVVFGTGFKQDLGMLPAELRSKAEADGLWLYRNIVHPDLPSCFFVGSQVTTFTNITTGALQARWVAMVLKGKAAMPSREQMHAEVSAVKDWKRRTMPYAGASRSTMLQLHQLHYHDELLKDMGYSIRRKSNPISELLDPYRPSDYGDVISGVAQQTAAGVAQSSFLRELLLLAVACGVVYCLQ